MKILFDVSRIVNSTAGEKTGIPRYVASVQQS